MESILSVLYFCLSYRNEGSPSVRPGPKHDITFPAVDVAAGWNGGVKLRILNVFLEERHEAERRLKLNIVYITLVG